MNCQLLSPPSTGAVAALPDRLPRLKQFALYDDLPAGITARWLTGELTRLTAGSRLVTVESWRTGVATQSARWRGLTLQSAGEADLLVFCVSNLFAANDALARWLDDLLPLQAARAQRSLMIALLGDAGAGARELAALVDLLECVARRGDMDFTWQPMGVRQLGDAAWLAPCLERVLAGR